MYLSLQDFAQTLMPYKLAQSHEEFPFFRCAAMHRGHQSTLCEKIDPEFYRRILFLIEPNRMPVGSLQIISTKVLNLRYPESIHAWKNQTLHIAVICGLDFLILDLL